MRSFVIDEAAISIRLDFGKIQLLFSLVSYLGHSLGGLTPFAEVQSVYSTAPVDWTSMISSIPVSKLIVSSRNISYPIIVSKQLLLNANSYFFLSLF